MPPRVVEIRDGPTTYQIGLFLATPGRSESVTGHVVWCCRQRDWAILTAAPAPLRELDPDVEIEELP